MLNKCPYVLEEITRDPSKKVLLVVNYKKDIPLDILPALQQRGVPVLVADQTMLGETFKLKYDKIVCYNVPYDNRFMTCMYNRIKDMPFDLKCMVMVYD